MSKISCLLAILLMASQISHAQFTKGTKLIGGNFSLTSIKRLNDSEKTQNFTIAPALGIAVRENLVFGGELIFAAPLKADRYNAKTAGIGAFTRRYFTLGKNVHAFGEGALSYTRQWYRIESFPSEYRNITSSVQLSISPGIAYTVNRNIQLELMFSDLLSAGYSLHKTRAIEGVGPNDRTTRNFYMGGRGQPGEFQQLMFGLRFLIP